MRIETTAAVFAPHPSFDNLLMRSENRLREQATAAIPAGSRVRQAIDIHLDGGGKRVRARLAIAASRALAVDPEDAVRVALCCELLHNASLIHDDLQDRDRDRRGRASIWAAFGEDIALLAGDLLLSAAYAAMADLNPDLFRLVHERTASTIAGQEADLGGASGFKAYERIAAGKSGPLLSLPLELPLTLAGCDSCVPIARAAAEDFAIGYQIVDDLEDVERDDPTRSRGSNAVWVLRAEHASRDAFRLAARHAEAALTRAIDTATRLPNDSGALLGACAEQLRQRLREGAGR